MDIDDLNVCQNCITQSEGVKSCKSCDVRLCSTCFQEHEEHQ